jgi:hypothetical protein
MPFSSARQKRITSAVSFSIISRFGASIFPPVCMKKKSDWSRCP